MVRVTLLGVAEIRGDPLVRVSLVEEEAPQPLQLVEEDGLTLRPKKVEQHG